MGSFSLIRSPYDVLGSVFFVRGIDYSYYYEQEEWSFGFTPRLLKL